MSDEKALMVVNPETLIAKAIEKGLPVETMERLLAMRRELKEEWARERYFQALTEFQKECPIIKKTIPVKNKDESLRYRYAPMDSIIAQTQDLLHLHGFSYTIQTKQEDNLFTAVCISHHKDGHSESSEFSIPIEKSAYMSAAQEVATAQTYAKRYAFNNAHGILTGDGDTDAKDTETDKEGDKETDKETDKNGKHKWPEDWQPILQEINDMLVEKPFDKNDRKDVYAQCLKCKMLKDDEAVKTFWEHEKQERIAAQESLDETASKIFEEDLTKKED